MNTKLRRRSIPLVLISIHPNTILHPSASVFANGLKLTALTNDPFSIAEQQQQQQQRRASSVAHQDGYGVDHSFPTHHSTIQNGQFDIEERKANYDGFMKKCQMQLGYTCDESERMRMETNLMQPGRIKNYTDLGFQKVATPPKLHQTLVKVLADYDTDKWDKTGFFSDNAVISMNHWESPSLLLDLDDPWRAFVWEETRQLLQRWVGVDLTPSSMYGRVWSSNALIPPHLDASPLIVSALIRIAEVVDEPWITELIGHDGVAYNVTLNPGEMLMYEGASVIHGRPFEMKGFYSADLFVHFEPVGYYRNYPVDTTARDDSDLEDLYQKALSKAKMAKNDNPQNSIQSMFHPKYIEPNSLESKRWMQIHKRTKLRITLDTSNLNAHTAASAGDLEALIAIYEKEPALLKKVDGNGWTPLHEAVRSEEIEIIKYLLDKGLDVNQRTHHGDGGSPLWWAKHYHGKESKVVKFLEEQGALEIPPDKGS